MHSILCTSIMIIYGIVHGQSMDSAILIAGQYIYYRPNFTFLKNVGSNGESLFLWTYKN